ncbi:MAG: glycosyltransferase family 4 protein, partial [Nitrospira sp.]|nr:glycosyltransferase family 4 protein [Nitrospira sp.]
MVNNSPIVLVLCHRNLFEGGERNLILERARALWEYGGIASCIVAVGSSDNIEPFSLHQEFPGVTVKATRLTGIGAVGSLQRNLLNHLREKEHESNVCGVILSGIFALPLAKTVKRVLGNRPLLIDVHGAMEELIEYPNSYKFGFLKVSTAKWPWRFLYYWAQFQLKKALRFADAALIVSRPMGDYLHERYGSVRTLVVPCGISQKILNVDQLIQARKRRRDIWKVADEDPVFCYVGGLSEWQCVSEGLAVAVATINHMKRGAIAIATNSPAEAKILAQKAGVGEKLVCVEQVHESEIINWLAGGDAGLLLRHTNITNRVAFPNKFAQYLAAGLLVLTSSG